MDEDSEERRAPRGGLRGHRLAGFEGRISIFKNQKAYFLDEKESYQMDKTLSFEVYYFSPEHPLCNNVACDSHILSLHVLIYSITYSPVLAGEIVSL